MSIVTSIITRQPGALQRYAGILRAIVGDVLPPGQADMDRLRVSRGDGLLTAVWGRDDAIDTHGHSTLAGVLRGAAARVPWWKLGAPGPDGSFALIRAERDRLEIFRDFAGSRPLWITRLPCGGVAVSTVFEVLIALLGDFAVNDEALGWFLSSGTAGPGVSWDARVALVPRNTRICVTRAGDSLEIEQFRGPAVDTHVSAAAEKMLGTVLWESLADFEFREHDWLLALSGGYDSRALLDGLKHVSRLSCTTWGDPERIGTPMNDIDIARRLAAKAGRAHETALIQRPSDAAEFERALRRFVRYNDGRTDNCLGYLDGMQIWDEMGNGPAGAILRGDEVLGSNVARSESHVLKNMRLLPFSHFARDSVQTEMRHRFGHDVPAELRQEDDESCSRWRWRLRLEHEIPTVYAALNGVRNRFMESVCPLLTRKLISCAATLPDSALDNKNAFHRVVADCFGDVPFATDRAILYRSDLLKIDQVRNALIEHLADPFARDVLGKRIARLAAKVLESAAAEPASGWSRIQGSVSTGCRRLAGRAFPRLLQKPRLGINDLVVRSYLARLFIEEMNSMARTGRQQSGQEQRVHA